MSPVVCPNLFLFDSRCSLSGLEAEKANILNTIYPGGALTTSVDTVEEDHSGQVKPTGCARIDRYTITNPGGRTGGSASYTYRLVPSSARVNKCLVFYCGHGQSTATFTNIYGADAEHSILIRMLFLGWDCLVIELPNYYSQPTQEVVVNGTLSAQTKGLLHVPYGISPPFDAPSITRLYSDHVIRSMNYLEGTIGITKFALVGHSGGAMAAILLATLDSRFKAVHILQGFKNLSRGGAGVIGDWEGYFGGDVFSANRGLRQHQDLIVSGSCHEGRQYVVHISPNDEYQLGDITEARNFVINSYVWTSLYVGATLSIVSKDTPSTILGSGEQWHNISPEQAALVESMLVSAVT